MYRLIKLEVSFSGFILVVILQYYWPRTEFKDYFLSLRITGVSSVFAEKWKKFSYLLKVQNCLYANMVMQFVIFNFNANIS